MTSPLDCPWVPAENMHIGGWGVYPEGEVLGEGYEVADFCDEATAKYIAGLHNAALAPPVTVAPTESGAPRMTETNLERIVARFAAGEITLDEFFAAVTQQVPGSGSSSGSESGS